MGIRLLKNTASATEPAEISDREYWQQEKKKAIWNLLIFFAAVVIVAIAIGTAAWFASNREVSGNNMQILAEVPEYVQISVGYTSDEPLNSDADYLILSNQMIQAPRETEETVIYDWSNQINISNYYRFGRLMPASSDSGRHILFTPDATGGGKSLKANARFYLADGKTDGNLKTLSEVSKSGEDNDVLMATAYAFQSVAEKERVDFWDGYRHATTWYNTNDDGYYVDIPIWLRTNGEEDIYLSAEGYITKKNGEISTGNNDPDALYKAVRVALLKEQNNQLVPAVLDDVGGKAKNIIPIQNAQEYGSIDKSILDSQNYTITRDTNDEREDGQLFGVRLISEENLNIRQAENYVEYAAYNGESVVTLTAAESEDTSWGEAKKLIIRVWLDGDDKDCWNATAGQDWSIHLRFVKL